MSETDNHIRRCIVGAFIPLEEEHPLDVHYRRHGNQVADAVMQLPSQTRQSLLHVDSSDERNVFAWLDRHNIPLPEQARF